MKNNKFIYYLSIGILLNAVLAGVCAFFVQIPEQNRELVSTYYSFSFLTAGVSLVRYIYNNINSKSD